MLKSKLVKFEQPANMPLMSVALFVLKLLNVMLVNALKLANKLELLTGALIAFTQTNAMSVEGVDAVPVV